MIAASNSFPLPDDSDGLNRRIEACFSTPPDTLEDLSFKDIENLPLDELLADEQFEDCDFEELKGEKYYLKESETEDAENIALGTYTHPADWEDLMDHLNNVVANELAEGTVPAATLAKKLGISEAALYDYLNPETPSYLGGFFLPAKEILKIDEKKIFPAYKSKRNLDICMESLTSYLSGTTAIGFKHLLRYRPGKEYRTYLRDLFISKLGLHTETDDFARDNNVFILSKLDEKLKSAGFPYRASENHEHNNKTPLTPGEQIFKICDQGDFKSFLDDLPYNSLESALSFYGVLGISFEELVPVRPLSEYERDEIRRRKFNLTVSNKEFFNPDYFVDIPFVVDEVFSTYSEDVLQGAEYDQLLDLPPANATQESKEPYQIYLESNISEASQRGVSLHMLCFVPNLLFNNLPT